MQFVSLCAPLIFSTVYLSDILIFSGVPGHRGMQDNEVVDQLANIALTGFVPNCSSLAYVTYFQISSPGPLKAATHLFSSRDRDHLRYPWRIDLCHSRNTAVIFLRLGHGVPSHNFYLHWIGFARSPLCPYFSVAGTIQHYHLTCRRFSHYFRSFPRPGFSIWSPEHSIIRV